MFPDHLPLHMKIEPNFLVEPEALVALLEQVTRGSERVAFQRDVESAEIYLAGVSELDLVIFHHTLITEHGLEFSLGPPVVAYREMLACATEIEYVHKERSGSTVEFARVKMQLEPNETGKGNAFHCDIDAGSVPVEFMRGVEKGVASVWSSGVKIGFPLVDMKVTVSEVAFHEVYSSPRAFEIAACAAMWEGCHKAGVIILEPVMDVEVFVPTHAVQAIERGLDSLRGTVRGRDAQGELTTIRAFVPTANMFGYITHLRSLTDGRGRHTDRFAYYQYLPMNVAGPGNFPPAIGMRA